MKSIDLTGKKFGKLTVIERAIEQDRKGVFWKCICDCGNFKVARPHDMKEGKTLSCGCLKKETAPKKHGMRGTRIHGIWTDMKTRCNNTKDKHYKYYGARGITICEEWLDFIGFYKDMKEGYAKTLTLDRIDNNLGYYKENCRWATIQEQCDNRRSNHNITYNGITGTLTNICKQNNVSRSLITDRIKTGMSVEEAIEKPTRSYK